MDYIQHIIHLIIKIVIKDGLAKPIHIGSNIWFGASVTVTPGVSIGDGSVIAAGSVVTNDIPPNSLAAGVPAKVIRTIDQNETINMPNHFE